MNGKKQISKDDLFKFLNQSKFLEYYYDVYLDKHLQDDFIEKNKEKLKFLISSNAYDTIYFNAQKNLLNSNYKLPLTDYQNLTDMNNFTQHLENLLAYQQIL